jgi:hypothetical protein
VTRRLLVAFQTDLQFASRFMLQTFTSKVYYDKHCCGRHGARCILLCVAHCLHGFRDAPKCSSGSKQLDRGALHVCRGIKVSSKAADIFQLSPVLEPRWFTLEAKFVPDVPRAFCLIDPVPDSDTRFVNRLGSGGLVTCSWAWHTWPDRNRRIVTTLTRYCKVIC